MPLGQPLVELNLAVEENNWLVEWRHRQKTNKTLHDKSVDGSHLGAHCIG
jgi:hypothetical protein